MSRSAIRPVERRPAKTRPPLRGIRTGGAALMVAVLVFASVSCGTAEDTNGSSLSTTDTDDQTAAANDHSRNDKNGGSHRSNGSKRHDGADDTDQSGTARDVDDSTSKPDRPRGKTYLVTDVVDGDTVHLAKRGETSVRIIGIDTPETVDPSTPDECGGPAASAAAERLLAGQRVRLVYDPSQGRIDNYGRVLGYIDIPGVGDFGERMITRGLAAEYTYDTAYQRRPLYLAAQRRAQSVERGVWNRCGGVDTPLTPPATEPETQAPPADPGAGCAPGYDPCVPAAPPDLDCDDVNGPVRITGDDPHGFDADGDGIGCDT